MITVTNCLECGAKIPQDAKGLCPKCLLKLGLASQLSPGFIETGVQAPPFLGFNRNDPARRLAVGSFEFGGYRILRLLGKGGMGAVYEAEELASGRRLALKVLGHSLDSPETRRRFLREGRLAASINHPNSVYVYGTEEIEGAPVITMELVPGGTLHERVKATGPLPVAEAVDVILQIIAGLEAAHAAGILHRDIKPSNCFIGPAGAVKVGDFGLSVSTLSRGDSALTLAGSVLGTPEFSAPEQLRGEALDLRADIYSVGMTLYYLLAGKTPFQAENLVQLLATVLERPAPSPRTFRPEIPEPLARIVLRCLAKQSGDRFGNYDELRRALLPFTSSAPTPATLGLRFVAGVVDHLVFMVLGSAASLLLFGGISGMADVALMHSLEWFWFCVAMFAFNIAYFAVAEGRWGATPGKALVGLRVAGLNRDAPGVGRALLRAMIYMAPTMVLRFHEIFGSPESMVWNVGAGVAVWLYPALLCATARRRNGFATLLDLVTKTRVIQKSAYEPRELITQQEEPLAATDALPKIGPYHALATLAGTESEQLILGYDTKLLRRVWIRTGVASAAPVTSELRNTSRPGRLRWLQGQRQQGIAWDAYEAAPGAPLLELPRRARSWKEVRHWLFDLAEEFAAASRDRSMPATLALDRVWITTGGGAKLLDFPAPGSTTTAEPVVEPAAFLNQLAIFGLEGQLASPGEAGTRAPRAPVAIRARGLLRILRLATDFAALAAELKVLVEQRPAISRWRRLGLIAGCAIPSLIIACTMILSMKTFAEWQRNDPDVMRLKSALMMHERMQAGGHPPGVDPAIGLQAAEIFIAGRYGGVLKDSRLWSSQYARSVLKADEREAAERIMARHQNVTPADMARARAALGPVINAEGELGAARRSRPSGEPTFSAMSPLAYGSFIWAAFLSLAAALLCRGGVLMRALGIAVVTREGCDASRLRMLWRVFLAWSWLPLSAVSVALLVPLIPMKAAMGAVAFLIVGVVALSASLPERSLHDRLAGTWLVPR